MRLYVILLHVAGSDRFIMMAPLCACYVIMTLKIKIAGLKINHVHTIDD